MEEDFPKLIKLATKFDDVPGRDKKFRGSYRAEDLISILKEQKNLSLIRGEIISSSLNTEIRVNEILSRFFFPEDDSKRRLFLELFLEKEFFTFMQKWKTLRELLNLGKLKIRNGSTKFLLDKIHNIIEIRNNFAHGEIIFFGKLSYLRYLKDGKLIQVRLDKKYLFKLSRLFKRTITLLEYLNQDSGLHSHIA